MPQHHVACHTQYNSSISSSRSPKGAPAPLDLCYARVALRDERLPGAARQPCLLGKLSPGASLIAGVLARVVAAGGQAPHQLVGALQGATKSESGAQSIGLGLWA